jgi:hypothetical protein
MKVTRSDTFGDHLVLTPQLSANGRQRRLVIRLTRPALPSA